MSSREENLKSMLDQFLSSMPPPEMFDVAYRITRGLKDECCYGVKELLEYFVPRELHTRELWVRVVDEKTVPGGVIDTLRSADNRDRILYYYNWAKKLKLSVGVK